MNNPFWSNVHVRISYAVVWAIIIVARTTVFYFFTDYDLLFVLQESALLTLLQATGILLIWFPIRYYLFVRNTFLLLSFHFFLFLFWSAIYLGASYLFTATLFPCPEGFSPFFLHTLPLQFASGLPVYTIAVLAYYLFILKTELKAKEEALENAQEENRELPVEKLTRITLKKNNSIQIIPVERIHCVEANGDYVLIYTSDGRYIKDKTMKYWESHLPDDLFVRVHRSFIINLEQIARIELSEKETYMIELKSGQKVKVSGSGYKLLRQRMN